MRPDQIPHEYFDGFQVRPHRTVVGLRHYETPVWAVKQTAQRMLLVRYLERRAGHWYPQPGTEHERLERAQQRLEQDRPRLEALLKRLCLLRMAGPPYQGTTGRFISKRTLDGEICNIDSQLNILNRGVAGTVLRIVHLTYGCGLDSVEVAIEVGMRPPCVRQVLHKLRELWNRMRREAGDPAAWRARQKARGVSQPAAYGGHTRARGAKYGKDLGPVG